MRRAAVLLWDTSTKRGRYSSAENDPGDQVGLWKISLIIMPKYTYYQYKNKPTCLGFVTQLTQSLGWHIIILSIITIIIVATVADVTTNISFLTTCCENKKKSMFGRFGYIHWINYVSISFLIPHNGKMRSCYFFFWYSNKNRKTLNVLS